MSLPLPRLDDRTWQDLRDEAVTLIPRYAPSWTDHNATDPGITLIELLAYQTEANLFRLDQIGTPFRHAFLRLLGEQYSPAGPRPAVTLLAYTPMPEESPAGKEKKSSLSESDKTIVRAGEYLVPRPPVDGTATRRYGHNGFGHGEAIGVDRIRQAGEPDEAMLHSDSSDESPVVPEFGFRAAHDVDLTGIRLAALQSFDGREYRDLTSSLARGQAVPVWGDCPSDPEGRSADKQPAVYIGLNLLLAKALSARDNASPPAHAGRGERLIFSTRNQHAGADHAGQKADWAFTLWCVPDGSAIGDLSSLPESFSPTKDPVAPPPAGTAVPNPARGFLPYDPERSVTPHHGVTVCWEYWFEDAWRTVLLTGFRDETRGFTQPGRLVFPGGIFPPVNSPAAKKTVGTIPVEHFYIRCRLCLGRPDASPQLRHLIADAVLVEQWDRTFTEKTPENGMPPATLGELRLGDEANADVTDAANDLALRGWPEGLREWDKWPLWGANGFVGREPGDTPPLEKQTGRPQAVVVGVGTGESDQYFALPCPSGNTFLNPDSPDNDDETPPIRILTDTLQVWTLEPPWGWTRFPLEGKWRAVRWRQVPDLNLSNRRSADFRLWQTPTASPSQSRTGKRSRFSPPGRIVFGDGEMGRVPPPGSIIMAAYSWSMAEAANFAAGFIWAKATDTDPDHPGRVVDFPTVPFRNVVPAGGGRDEETLSIAMNRLANELAAPEGLIDRADAARQNTLDGLSINGLQAPPMAVNLLDFECLARSVPGTGVVRARAWAETDPRHPGVVAPGAITVVVVPQLPLGRPMPTDGLLRRVHAFLCERRHVTGRSFVIGPEYTVVRVRATLHTSNRKIESVRTAAESAVRTFLHPTLGGPSGRGWPFGRDLHVGELLRILAGISGVQYVSGLRLAGENGEWGEKAVGVPARSLVDLTELNLEVRGDA
ncbi:baseplate J/gp47 family protein [Zavarzinella formosa]|uniref:baseplate J/gp47 family protein n=1 Tax=Zavarzinella formosa TaxID=360055 RepID=UPI0003148265|nr:baseplate J/gp47 family protein [Zavarzinella formosa]